MSRRANKDPVAEQSSRLCDYMNEQPIVLLLYARYFGEYPDATNAKMTSIDQDGFDIACLDNGELKEVRVTFRRPMRAMGQVRDELKALAKEAEAALRKNGAGSQGWLPDSPSVELPDSDPLASFLLTGAYVALYLYFFPNTTNPFLQWILQLLGTSMIRFIVMLATGLHVLEAFISLYFTLVVAKDFFSLADSLQWFATIVFLGYPVLFRLVPLANRNQSKPGQSS
ncbi:MAG: hypothetical protein J3Q66DRAFT_322102 [Benniella sp.]|nr:MAG: hypothetical protein J3Q66DRAFT_322102 [Benniella sp.]